MDYSLQGKRVLVTGAGGFVGSNFLPLLEQKECEIIAVSRKDYNLLEQSEVRRMFAEIKPEVVFHFGALSGGKELLQSDESRNSPPRIVNISNDKIKKFAELPKTQESVTTFIKNWDL